MNINRLKLDSGIKKNEAISYYLSCGKNKVIADTL